MTEALSEWTAAEAARVAAAEEARDQEEMRRAEAASRSEGVAGGADDEEQLRRACADSLTSSRVRCAHAYSTPAYPTHTSIPPLPSPSACHARSHARTWRVREEEEALARAKADSLQESRAVDEAEAEELRRALRLSSVRERPTGVHVAVGRPV